MLAQMWVRREEEHCNISRLISIICDDTDDLPCLSPISPYYSHFAAFFDFFQSAVNRVVEVSSFVRTTLLDFL